MMKFNHAFVVTGTIGSGKSTFLNLLKMYGFEVIDADEISHEELEACKDEVVRKFGKEILSFNKIDRKKLGAIVFNDKSALKWLENLLHPRIDAKIYELCNKLEVKNLPYFVDIPLYFEGLGKAKFNYVVVVYAPEKTLIDRIMKRNGLSHEEAKNRIELQMDIEKKREMADFVIDNSGNLKDLQAQVDGFLRNLKGMYESIEV
ncbi:dephospho-CoA kinase [Campylobacter sp. RM15925]|uniref:dephospho-CoA kinase n=1 Tax=Campylobacter sp. RM15925 TaxID=1705724 RepID=UPI001B8BFC6E|nr:dephospho-CoA kinase [Campylobacter sp. RM15925]